jgi:hypothetical protein
MTDRPEAYKLVPVEPTEAMCDAGSRASCFADFDADESAVIYGAMLAAAPQVQQEPVVWQCCEHGEDEWNDCGREAYGINPQRYKYRELYAAPPAQSSDESRAEEREACAQLAEGHFIPGHSVAGPAFALILANKIRARGQTAKGKV